MSRFLIALAAGTLFIFLAAPAAVSKEGVRARLDTPVPLEAAPGDKITIAWTLRSIERGQRRPFGASGVFVRLLSASDGEPVKALGKAGSHGGYVAEVTVPQGGIGGIRIGLEGIRYIGGRTEDADVFFPIDNNPFAAADAAAGKARDSRTSDPTPGGGQTSATWLVVAGVFAGIGAILIVRRVALRAGSQAASGQRRTTTSR
jgi:hypothetical protein